MVSGFRFDLEGAVTIQDVIDRINLNVSNQDPLTKITASIHPIKNSLVLSSPSNGGTQAMKIIVGGGSEAAWSLGLVPQGETEAVANLNGTNTRLLCRSESARGWRDLQYAHPFA